MSREALPCIVCKKTLENVFDDAENQPNDGVYLRTHGQYGSTVFDPMNGEVLEVNICERCLKEAGEAGRVLIGRVRRPVLTPGHELIGWTNANYALVPWRAEMETSDDFVVVDDFDEFLNLAIEYGIQTHLDLSTLRELFAEDRFGEGRSVRRLELARDEPDQATHKPEQLEE